MTPDALWLPRMADAPMSIFSPVEPTLKGNVFLKTIMEQNPEKVLRHLENMAQSPAATETARENLLAMLAQYKEGIKSIAPYAVAPVAATGGLLGAMLPQEAKAEQQRKIREQALEDPWMNPVDMLLAPIGAATWLGRAAAVLAEPLIAFYA